MWKLIINKLDDVRDQHQTYCLEKNSGKITHPQMVTEAFNSYFIDKRAEIIEQNKNNKVNCNNQMLMNLNQHFMFLFPMTENEVEVVVTKLKGKTLVGVDEIPDFIVKDYIQLMRKPLCFIFNLYIIQGYFPDWTNIAKVKPIYKKWIKEGIFSEALTEPCALGSTQPL
jgi:hypothetical protein